MSKITNKPIVVMDYEISQKRENSSNAFLDLKSPNEGFKKGCLIVEDISKWYLKQRVDAKMTIKSPLSGEIFVDLMMKVVRRGDDTDDSPSIELEFVKLLSKDSAIKKYNKDCITIPKVSYANYPIDGTEITLSLFKLDEEVPDDPAQKNLDENIKK
jgi:hypothetical protein